MKEYVVADVQRFTNGIAFSLQRSKIAFSISYNTPGLEQRLIEKLKAGDVVAITGRRGESDAAFWTETPILKMYVQDEHKNLMLAYDMNTTVHKPKKYKTKEVIMPQRDSLS